MKKNIQILSIVILLNSFLIPKTFSQEESLRKFGIGISLFSLNDLTQNIGNGGYANTIYFPININDKFRLEPEIGFMVYSGHSFSSISLGFFKLQNTKNVLLKYGIRVGTTSEQQFQFSPTIGAEYFLSSQFSLGAEAQLKILNYHSETYFLTTTSASVRFYF